MNTVPAGMLRGQLYKALCDMAFKTAANTELTRDEACLVTIHNTLDIIDGGAGNRPDGLGLPLLQLMPCPHPDFNAALKERGRATYDNGTPLNDGLVGTEYQTGIADDFAHHYHCTFEDDIKSRQFKSAKELFGSKD